MMRIMIILTYPRPTHQTPSPAGSGGGGEQGQGRGSLEGAGPLWTLSLEVLSVPKAPGPRCQRPSELSMPGAQAHLGHSGTYGSAGLQAGSVTRAGLILEGWAFTSCRWPGQHSSAQGRDQAGQRGHHQVGGHPASS